jgi:SnoaL-like protein
MSTIVLSKTEEILNHHVTAFVETNLDGIMDDYTDKSELLTPQGPVSGLSAIRSWFEEIFKAVPKGSTLDLKQTIIRDNVAYIVWPGESPFVSIPFGVDTFVIENDKILFQALGAQIVPKQ